MSFRYRGRLLLCKLAVKRDKDTKSVAINQLVITHLKQFFAPLWLPPAQALQQVYHVLPDIVNNRRQGVILGRRVEVQSTP